MRAGGWSFTAQLAQRGEGGMVCGGIGSKSGVGSGSPTNRSGQEVAGVVWEGPWGASE
jgi:hypothetical protein